MKINTTPFRQWFGFTRRERRASLMLIILIAIVICVRLLIPDSKVSANYIPIDTELDKSDSVKNISMEAAIAPEVQSRPISRRYTPIDINSCDSTELLQLPGIGPVLSGRIIRFRNLLGGYASIDQLQEVYGLRPETFDLIKDRVTADTTLIDKIDINSADFRRFVRLPYFERKEVNDIIKYREVNGKIHSVDELIKNNILSDDKVAKIKPYLRFDQ